MSYIPRIKDAKPQSKHQVGKYPVVFLGDIESAGSVTYFMIAVVYNPDTKEPCFCVASGVNDLAEVFGGGSHFLDVFDGMRHANYGTSDDWGDPDKFTAKAFEITQDQYG